MFNQLVENCMFIKHAKYDSAMPENTYINMYSYVVRFVRKHFLHKSDYANIVMRLSSIVSL